MRQHHRAFFRSAALPPTRRPPSFSLLRPLRHGIPRSPALCPFCFSTDSMSQSTFRYKSRSSPEFTSSKRPLALERLCQNVSFLYDLFMENLFRRAISIAGHEGTRLVFSTIYMSLFSFSLSFYRCWNSRVIIENY